MNEAELCKFLKENLSIRVSRGGSYDPNTLEVELILNMETVDETMLGTIRGTRNVVIASDSVDITPRPEYEG